MANSKNIESQPFTAVNWQPGKMVEGLNTLREEADRQALKAIDWYYEKKRSKNLWSHRLRFLAIAFSVLGGLVPILTASGILRLFPHADEAALRLAELQANQFGYVLLGLAAGCVAFDRFFGFSTNWMRYIGAAMRIETARNRFRFEWESLLAPLKGREPTDERVHEILEAIEKFSLAVREAVEHETGAWVSEFQTNLSQLDKETEALFKEVRTQKKALEDKAEARKGLRG